MRKRYGTLALVVAGLVTGLAGGCAPVEAAEHEPVPAVEIADGPDEDGPGEDAPKTLTLTADAVRRLELETVVVDDPAAIPYAAVVYDKTGAPWVYSSPTDRTFIRLPVTIERVEGDVALLTTGPPAGTRITTRAAIKLYGAETGVGGGH